MNLSNVATVPGIRQRINWQALTLVGGIALAIGVAIGVGALERGGTSATVSTPETVSGSVAPLSSETTMRPRVVIVSSEAQREAFEQEMLANRAAAANDGFELSVPSTSFLVLDSPENLYLYEAVLADKLTSDSFDIVIADPVIAEMIGSRGDAYPPEGAVEADYSLPTTFGEDSTNSAFPPVGAVEVDYSLPTTFQ